MKQELQEKNYRETKHLTKDELRKLLHEKNGNNTPKRTKRKLRTQ
jgi:predicted phosphoribosyltransferase